MVGSGQLRLLAGTLCAYERDGLAYELQQALVYVDDLLVVGNSMKGINCLKSLLDKEFNIKDLGELRYFLGMEVARAAQGINICQRKYALNLIKDTIFLGAKPYSNPMDSNAKLYEKCGTVFKGPSKYSRIVGRLIHLTHTRPDIVYSVSHLSQFLANPTNLHYQVALRIVKYLKNEPGKGLFYPSQNNTKVKGFSDFDFDWGSDLDTRRSITGLCFSLVTPSFHGRVRDKKQSQGPQQKQNIAL
ncbi:PREDICTED: uncharacterized protein LOC109326375 [Lupinus angustifolius]|uniref:uncharacterized protein LOC109326375 n=1 Tax=Lupinus angustifolius TaxID=3871 RepID=UPI00092E3917|nr:PREDICTED: uncharacterized protein LOC109326375 [Lupinus angustifolius]